MITHKNKILLEKMFFEDNIEKEYNIGCGFIMRTKPNRAVLIVKRAKEGTFPHHWELPRGHCKENEDYKDCAKREIKEETGLDVIFKDNLGIFNYFENNNKIKAIQHNFLFKLKDEDQRIILNPREHSKYMWVSNMGRIEALFSDSIEMKEIFYKGFKIMDKE